MKIYENEFMIINLINQDQTLELLWKPKTASMTTSDFKAALYVYACFAIEYHTPRLLVHIHEFGFRDAMSDALTEWRNQHIFPKYNGAGVIKFAFLGHKEQLPPQDPPQTDLANFQTRFFSDRLELENWFNIED
ncbi:hypothetical protein QQ020_08340 [Fulvivirgaceae bacterium BMA12]|uniref:Uncharacterized protein n=1 Tax=Agaribacillus aureus TaxID=3051825 RepID=A0ABT8L4T9_9BACT|nr:hypothetical protein [Fulvivirgaceae bacterium BMA12]